MNTLEKVIEFHDGAGIRTPTKACVPDWSAENAQALSRIAGHLRYVKHLARAHVLLGKNEARCLQRIALEAEELAEKAQAMADNDLLGLFDACEDGQYVADGTVAECGLGLVHYAGFDLVHDSNMSKRFPDGTFHRDATGKIIKGPDYKPVDLTKLLARVTKP